MCVCVFIFTDEQRKKREEFNSIVENNANMQLEISKYERMIAAEIVTDGIHTCICVCISCTYLMSIRLYIYIYIYIYMCVCVCVCINRYAKKRAK